MTYWSIIRGLIPILGGVYLILAAQGIFPRNPKDPEKMALWRRKFGAIAMFLGPVMILGGIARFFGFL